MTQTGLPKEVFISYRRSQSASVCPAVAALEAAGIRCFLDQIEIDPLEAFPQRLNNAIADSLALLAWWSGDFAGSDHCLAEFRLAWQHSRRQSSRLEDRLWVLNPLATVEHIAAGELDAQNFLKAPVPGKEVEWAQHISLLLAPRLDALRLRGTMANEVGALTPGRLYNVPPLATHFIGRNAVLMRIHSRLHPAKVGAQIQNVAVQTHGLAGIGKTELATAYARQFGQAYPGGVFWIKLVALDGHAVVNRNLGQLAWLGAVEDALQYSPHAGLLRDEKDQLLAPAAARQRLAALILPGAALWVLDNVPVLTPVPLRDELLAFWRAPMRQAHTLITTRDGSEIDGFTPERLDVMSDDDALRLLASYRKPVSGPEQVAMREIVRRTGAHTQALVLLGTHIAGSPQSYAALLAELDQVGALERIEEVAASLQENLGARARGVLAAFVISLRPLSADARLLLTLAALCESNSAFPAALLSDTAELGSDAARKALGSLRRSALLVKRDSTNSELSLVEIHPLTAQTALALLAGLEPVAGHVLGNGDSRIAPEAWLSLRRDLALQLLGALKDAADIRSHQISQPYLAQARHFARELEDELAVALGMRVASYAQAEGLYTLAHRDKEQALNLARRVLGEEHPATVLAMGSLANTLRYMGKYVAARTMLEQVLPVIVREFGEEHHEALATMNNLACTLWSLGEYVAARRMRERVLVVNRQMLGEEHLITLICMSNLANTLFSMGEYADARTMQERVLAVMRRTLGEEHPDTLISMNNLASTLQTLGDSDDARAIQEKVLADMRRVLGEEHPETLNSMNNLAGALSYMGDHPGARALQERVLAVNRRLLGDQNANTLTYMNNHASTLQSLGEHVAARTLQEQVLTESRRTLGHEHPATLMSMSNLANTFHAMGEQVNARNTHERVLEIRRRVLGEEHPDTLASMNNLAAVHLNMGELAEARALQNQELAICRRVLGEEHLDTLTCMNNLAATLSSMGEHAAARTLKENVVGVIRRVMGENHPNTLTSMNNLASTLWNMGEHAAARIMMTQVVVVTRRVLGDAHPNTLAFTENLKTMSVVAAMPRNL